MIESNLKPDFFIIGAPKCGTTALSIYLGQHPNIGISSPKEPMYFCTDWPSLQIVQDEKEYLRCFDCCDKKNILSMGEGSALYLLSQDAISSILDFNPQAKFIIMVRNPIDMAVSLHAQNLFYGDEDVELFDEAWKLQMVRAEEKNIPSGCRHPILLQYEINCKLGKLVKRAFSVIPESQRCVIVFDDFVTNTKDVYQMLLRYLNVPSDNRMLFPKVNARKTARLRWVNNLLAKPPRSILNLSMKLKHALHLKSLGVHSLVIQANTKTNHPCNIMSSEMNAILLNTFSDDIDLLGMLIKRDLSSWKE